MGGICCGPSATNEDEIKGPSTTDSPVVGLLPGGPPPAPKPAAATAAGGKGGLTFASVLANLEDAEQMVYGTSFQAFNSGNPVPYTHEGLMDFVATNSAISFQDMDTELVRVASANEDMQINVNDFMKVLRENAASDTAMLESFLNLAASSPGGSEAIEASECRSGLLMFFNDQLGPQVVAMSEQRWEAVFDAVMSDCGATVSMDAWTNYAKRVARVVRVVHLAKL